MAGTIRTIVKTTADNSGFKDAGAGADSFATKMANFSTIAGGFALGAGIAAAPAALMNMAKAAAEDEAATKRLDQALRNQGGAFEENKAKIDKRIEAGQKLAFSDDDVRDSFQKLLAATDDVDEAMRRQTVAMDLARGANIPLAQASTMLGKINEENVNVFRRMGIELADNATETEALAAIQQKFGGQAAAFGESTAGSWAKTGIAISEAKESMGALVLQGVNVATPAVAGLANSAQDLAGKWGELPGSTQGIVAGMAAIAIAGPPVVGTLASVAGSIGKIVADGPSTGQKLAGIGIGITAIAVGADLILQKTTGHGLIERIVGDPAQAEAATQAAIAFAAALDTVDEPAEKVAMAVSLMNQQIASFAADGGAAMDNLTGFEKFVGGADARLFGFNVGLSDGVDKMNQYQAAVSEGAKAMMANGASAQDLYSVYLALPPELQKTFDATTHVIEKIEAATWATQQYDSELVRAGISISGVATNSQQALSPLESFTEGLKKGADFAGALEKRLGELAERFTGLDPAYQANAVQIAILTEELGDLEASGARYSMSLGLTKKEIEGAIAAMEAQNGVMAENSDGYQAIASGMEAMTANGGMVSGTVLNIDQAIQAANVSQEEQIRLIGLSASALSAIANNDIPSAIAALVELGKSSPAAVREFVAGITDPAVREQIRAGGAGLGSAMVEGIVAGLNAGLGSAGAAGRELANTALREAAAALAVQSPSKEFEALGNKSVEGYVLGINRGQAEVAAAAAKLMGAGILSAGGVINLASKLPGGSMGAAAGFGGMPPILAGAPNIGGVATMPSKPLQDMGNGVWWDPNKGDFVVFDMGENNPSGVTYNPNNGGSFNTPVGANEVYRDAEGNWRSHVDGRIVTGADGSFENDAMRANAHFYQRTLEPGWGGGQYAQAGDGAKVSTDPRAGMMGFDPVRDMPGAGAFASGPYGNSVEDLEEMYHAQAPTINGERPVNGYYHGWMNESLDGEPWEVWIQGPDAWGGAKLRIGINGHDQERAWSSVVGYIGQTREQAKAKPMRRRTPGGSPRVQAKGITPGGMTGGGGGGGGGSGGGFGSIGGGGGGGATIVNNYNISAMDSSDFLRNGRKIADSYSQTQLARIG